MVVSIGHLRTSASTLVAAVLLLGCGSEDSDLPIAPSGSGSATNIIEETEPSRKVARNAPPTIVRLTLEPESPTQGEELKAVVAASDAEGDLVRFDFAWTVDGDRVDTSGSVLALDEVPKGSWVKVSVVARDRTGRSAPRDDQVIVANRAPRVREIVFEAADGISSENDLTASPRAFDPDGDDFHYRYRWWVNGVPTSDDDAVLPANRFKRGDEIVAEIVASDGEDESEPFESDAIRIGNARPKIVSAPSGFGGDAFRYVVEVVDPDGDRSMRFRLEEGPSGMTIDEISGAVSWVPSAEQEGQHPVVITVEDGRGGADTQRFDLSLGFESDTLPAAPDR